MVTSEVELFFQFWEFQACHPFRIIEVLSSVFNLLFSKQKYSVILYYRIGLFSYRYHSILILLYPQHYIRIFLLESLYLVPVITQVDNKLIIIH